MGVLREEMAELEEMPLELMAAWRIHPNLLMEVVDEVLETLELVEEPLGRLLLVVATVSSLGRSVASLAVGPLQPQPLLSVAGTTLVERRSLERNSLAYRDP